MNDNLEPLVNATGGEGPSPEFVARLRAAIVEETAPPAPPIIGASDAPMADDDTTVIELLPEVDHGEPRGPSRRMQLVLAAAAAVLVAVVGIWLYSTDDSDVDTVDTPEELESGAAPTPLAGGNTFIEAGDYRLDTLGTPIEFRVDQLTGLLLNGDGVVVMTDITSNDRDDRSLTMRRVSTLPDPADPTAGMNQIDGWPASDFDGWLDVVAEDGSVEVGQPTATSLGGRDATRVRIEVDELGCRATRACPGTSSMEILWTGPLLRPGSAYEIWMVDQGAADPLAIVIAIDSEDDRAWVTRMESLLATLEFGEPQPGPIRRVVGETELAVFGGARFEVAEESLLIDPLDGFARLVPFTVAGVVEFLTAPLALDGAPYESPDELLEAMAEDLVQVVEIEPTTIAGREARVFEVATGPFPRIVALQRIEDLAREESGWKPPQSGHLWMIDDPDLGLLVVASMPFESADDAPAIRSWAEGVLRTMEFGR